MRLHQRGKSRGLQVVTSNLTAPSINGVYGRIKIPYFQKIVANESSISYGKMVKPEYECSRNG